MATGEHLESFLAVSWDLDPSRGGWGLNAVPKVYDWGMSHRVGSGHSRGSSF